MVRRTFLAGALAALGLAALPMAPGADLVGAQAQAQGKAKVRRLRRRRRVASRRTNKISYDSYRGWMTSSDRKYYGR